MRFFDCNAYFGLPMRRPLAPVATAEELLAEMDHSGVDRSLVWHIAQHDVAAGIGNRLLAEEIAPHARLEGCWAILPAHTHELPPPRAFAEALRREGIAAVRIFPAAHRYLPDPVALGDYLSVLEERRIPLLVSLKRGVEWRDLYALLAAFPWLTCIVCDHGCWGQDRLFRPLLERYPRVCVDTALYLLDGGIESLVADYGAGRLLYGSGFPEGYHGGMMMAIKHAEIDEADKAAIAAGNLERILEEVAP